MWLIGKNTTALIHFVHDDIAYIKSTVKVFLPDHQQI